MIPYGRQYISETDIKAVVDVLRSDFLTQGPMVPLFESRVAGRCNAKFAIAVNSATSALHVACMALDLGPGDWLWTSPISFVASANCGLYCGASIDFVDIDPDTINMSPVALEQKLLIAEREGRLPKVIVPVHMGGEPCDMQSIHDLSRRFGFKVIEDASHAVGARYLGEPVGNCAYSDITVFSFHPVKIVTTAEGGMALTNSEELRDKMELYRSHGITRDSSKMTKPADGPWYYQQLALGFNYRMTEIQAALGVSQMNRLDDFVSRRHQLAYQYDRLLADLPISAQRRSADSYSSLHLYITQLQPSASCDLHLQIFSELRNRDIGVALHYIPIHLQPYFSQFGFKCGDFPNSERYYHQAMSLPLFQSMSDEQQSVVVQAVSEVLCSLK